MEITIDRGYRTYDIKDTDGTLVGTIRFNPADPGFAGRWQQAEAKIESYRQRINEMQASGVPEIDQWPLMMEASDAIKQAFDYSFGAPVSQVFFGGYSAFALTANGHTVLENVLEGVAPVIEKALKSAAKKAQQRMADHTAPYQGTTKGLAPGQTAAPAEKP